MKYCHFLSSILFVFFLQACKKEKPEAPPKQYSYWKVDGVEYSSNNVTSGIGKKIASFSSHDSIRFGLRFYLPYFPDSGDWTVVTENPDQDASIASLGFYIGHPPSTPYVISAYNTNKLTASRKNEKASYTLPPTWFVNYEDPTDSVLIEGEFNEP